MLFAAGIGATLLYWSTIEWIEYFNILSSDPSFDKDKVMQYSRAYPIFHWGPTAWAIYCLPVSIWFGYYQKTKSSLTFSGILNIKNIFLKLYLMYIYWINNMRCRCWIRTFISINFVCNIKNFEIDRSFTLDITTIILCSSIFATSAYIGIQNGIKD